MITRYKESKVNLANALEIGELKALDGKDLIIEYAKPDVFYSTWLNKNKRLIEEELLKEYSSTIHIKINEVDKPSSGMNNDIQRLNKKEVTKQLEKDPVINKLIDEFGLELT